MRRRASSGCLCTVVFGSGLGTRRRSAGSWSPYGSCRARNTGRVISPSSSGQRRAPRSCCRRRAAAEHGWSDHRLR
ncbi:hypothetical protein Micbo1qcDRAFT_161555, partial [Microdochium bolleyi]